MQQKGDLHGQQKKCGNKVKTPNLSVLTTVIMLDQCCLQTGHFQWCQSHWYSSQAIAVAKGLSAKTSSEGLTKQIFIPGYFM